MSAPLTPGAALRRHRLARGLTQEQFSVVLGCSPGTLCTAESGRRVPPRAFWRRADAMAGLGGKLLRLYDGIVPGPGPVWPVWDDGPEP